MSGTPIGRVVIVGGGTAGWMAAAAASRFLNDGQRTITLIESDAIGTVGVGEATIPPIRSFNARLGIDEADFLRATGGTPKLGIEFVDWGAVGERYMHPFGTPGRDIEGLNFHQLWLKLRDRPGIGDFEGYAMAAVAARAARPIKLSWYGDPLRIDPVARSERMKWSGRQDSNLRPPHPQCDALPGCATPRPSGGL